MRQTVISRTRATLIGMIAIFLWSLLAVLTVSTAPMPPLQLNAICFGLATCIGVVWLFRSNAWAGLQGISWVIYAFGTAGLFGYHLLYFTALRLAPAADAGLIAYLWPLLIVIFSGLLPEERLKAGHVVGALLGLTGAALIILQNSGGFKSEYALGFGFAFLCAMTWSGYSVLSRRLGDVPTSTVVVFCALTSVLSFGGHLLVETPVWALSAIGWGSVVALGLGPVGIAFFAWDVGVKYGDIQILAVASYAAPLLSTLFLVVVGIAALTPGLLVAAILITAGAVIAARSSHLI